jgi:hypothetical protein
MLCEKCQGWGFNLNGLECETCKGIGELPDILEEPPPLPPETPKELPEHTAEPPEYDPANESDIDAADWWKAGEKEDEPDFGDDNAGV